MDVLPRINAQTKQCIEDFNNLIKQQEHLMEQLNQLIKEKEEHTIPLVLFLASRKCMKWQLKMHTYTCQIPWL
ncbi:hypothetical protein, partial [Parageobacillus thermoglucosidasius]|uniref:hypothetical protein n=1 Tax=Parageobacillus thermoglucosidasius TaxID=1426 RepID=UPI000E142BBB